jgi:hypothetical protein
MFIHILHLYSMQFQSLVRDKCCTVTCDIVRNNRFYSLVYSTVKLGITKTTAWPCEAKITVRKENTKALKGHSRKEMSLSSIKFGEVSEVFSP